MSKPIDAIVLEDGAPPVICPSPYKAKDWPSVQMIPLKDWPDVVKAKEAEYSQALQRATREGFSPERKAWESRSELLPPVRLPVTYPPHPGYRPIGFGLPALAFVLGVLAVPLTLWLLSLLNSVRLPENMVLPFLR